MKKELNYKRELLILSQVTNIWTDHQCHLHTCLF